jgi:hypothetical protein
MPLADRASLAKAYFVARRIAAMIASDEIAGGARLEAQSWEAS